MTSLKRRLVTNNALILGIQKAFLICTCIFTFVGDEAFQKINFLNLKVDSSCSTVIIKIMLFGAILIVSYLYYHNRQNVYLTSVNYDIEIQYGDILQFSKGKILIPFDECFTTTVDETPGGINKESICGQFLMKNSIPDIKALIKNANVVPCHQLSKFRKQIKYESGLVIPYNHFLLMAFAKLDEKGLARMSLEQYLKSLWILWKELDTYYGQEDVFIPILGSGVTRFTDRSLTQQELLDIIIESYKLTPYKIKKPNKLHIVCRKLEGFSLNKIGHGF